MNNRTGAILTAKDWLNQQPLFLDTETTGLDDTAEFYGEWDDYHGNYRWQRLSNAARQCGIEIPADLHRARADAELTRQVTLYVARADT